MGKQEVPVMHLNNLAGFVLLAQDEAEQASSFIEQPWFMPAVIILSIILCSFVGRALAQAFRMSEYGWKLSLILICVTVSAELIIHKGEPRWGVDLSGGTTFIAQLKKAEDGEDSVPVATLVPRLKERLDPTGTKEIVVRALGEDKIEIIIPTADDQEAERIWKRTVSAGFLQFRILADEKYHQEILGLAREQQGSDNVVDAEGEIGRWVRLAREATPSLEETGEFRFNPFPTNLCRDQKTKEIVDWQAVLASGSTLNEWCDANGFLELEILVATPPVAQDVDGEDLQTVFTGVDDQARPAVHFRMKADGTSKFLRLTRENSPKNENYRQLGIVLDNALLSAPRIETEIAGRGQISGQFTRAEVEDLVGILKAGKLPAALNDNWISKDNVDSNIGSEMADQGIKSIGISFGLVLIFMLIYYRFSGMLACAALLLNLLLIMALIMLINQPITLTGLAGLVLTVGMSVDANVLIFERIREETNRGSSLRMAIRNGFDRATTTIVDANVTTLITAIVLYAIGTEQIKGFSVMLILGILMSMFTAIFCARVAFDIAERMRWIDKLTMMEIVGTTKFDFIGKRGIAGILSVAVIATGLFAVGVRGGGIFGHDLRGGTTARIVFDEPTTVEDVRAALQDRFLGKGAFENNPVIADGEQQSVEVSELTSADLDPGTIFKVDTSLRPIVEEDAEGEYPDLRKLLLETFDKLARYSVEINDLKTSKVAIEAEGENGDQTSDKNGDEGEQTSQNSVAPIEDGVSQTELPADSLVAFSGEPKVFFTSFQGESEETATQQGSETETDETSAEPVTQQKEAETETAEEPATTETPAEETQATPATTEQEPTADGGALTNPTTDRYQATAKLEFAYLIAYEAVVSAIENKAVELGLQIDKSLLDVDNDDYLPDSPKAFKIWDVTVVVLENESGAQQIFEEIQADFAEEPYFRSLSGVGGQIASESQVDAFVALFASLVGIVLYIWIRFQKVVYGLAAVVALGHDVFGVLCALSIR